MFISTECVHVYPVYTTQRCQPILYVGKERLAPTDDYNYGARRTSTEEDAVIETAIDEESKDNNK